jgi:predicted lipid-binding transport protein (Tim44 family)
MDVPVDIDRDTARRAAAEELSDPKYRDARPNILQQVGQWLGEQLEKLLNGLSSVVPGGIFGLLLILVLLIVLVVVIRLRTGKVARAVRAERAVFGGKRQSADDYRRSAAEAAAGGRYDDAVRDRFRAVVRALEERALLDVRSGRTADEAAAEAGALLPNVADALRQGARLFDDVHYGGRDGTEAAYRTLTELDERCRRERPVAMAGP